MKLIVKLTLYEATDAYGGGKGDAIGEVVEFNVPTAVLNQMVTTFAVELPGIVNAMVAKFETKNKES